MDKAISYFDDKDELPIDTETTGFDPHVNELICVQIGDYENQFVIDWNGISKEDKERLRLLIESKVFLAHHAKFDLKFMYKHRIIPRRVYDTMIGEDVLNTGLIHKKNLATVAKVRLNVDLDKSVRDTIFKEGLTDRVILYAADDVKYLQAIKAQQIVELNEKNLGLTMRLENNFSRVLAYVEWSGMRVDELMWKARTDEDIKRMNDKMGYLNDYVVKNYPNSGFVSRQLSLFSDAGCTCSVNWSSPLQVQKFMTSLGVKTEIFDKKAGKIKHSVDAKVIERQAKDFPIIKEYLEFKGFEKMVGTYGYNFFRHINEVTDRLHTQFQQIMDTGRMSSGGKNKITKEEFINFQNIPKEKEVRYCFIPNKGNSFIVSDFSGQEQIILANKSMDENLLEFYDKGLGDMHSFVAQKIFKDLQGLTLQEIKEQHPDKRDKAKTGGFAINYGGNGATVAENLGISEEEGNEVYEGYFEGFPGLKKYFLEAESLTHFNRYIFIDKVTGRKSFIHNIDEFLALKKEVDCKNFWDSYRFQKRTKGIHFDSMKKKVQRYFQMKGDIYRKSLNYPIQGEGASMTKIAGIYIFEEILKRGQFGVVLLPNTCHDEWLVECPTSEEQEWFEITHACMLKAGDLFCKRVPIKAGTKIGQRWEK